MWLPFRRRLADQPADLVAPSTSPNAGESRQAGWEELPALRPPSLTAVSAPPPVFRNRLGAAQPFPLAVASLGHGIDPQAPSGTVRGLALPRLGEGLMLAPPAPRPRPPAADDAGWWPLESGSPHPVGGPDPGSALPDPAAAWAGDEPEVRHHAGPPAEPASTRGALTTVEGALQPLPGRYRSASPPAVEPEVVTAEPVRVTAPTGRAIIRRTLGESRRMGLGPPLTAEQVDARSSAPAVSEPAGLESAAMPLVARSADEPHGDQPSSETPVASADSAVTITGTQAEEPPSEHGPDGDGTAAGADSAPLVGERLHPELVPEGRVTGEPAPGESRAGLQARLLTPVVEPVPPTEDRATAATPGTAEATAPLPGDAGPGDAGRERLESPAPSMPAPAALSLARVAGSPGTRSASIIGGRGLLPGLDRDAPGHRAAAPAAARRSEMAPAGSVPMPGVAPAGLEVGPSQPAGFRIPTARATGGGWGSGPDVGPASAVDRAPSPDASASSRRLATLLGSQASNPAVTPGLGAAAAAMPVAVAAGGIPAGVTGPALTLQRLPAEAGARPAPGVPGSDSEIGHLLAEIGATSGAALGPDGSISFTMPPLPAAAATGPAPAAGAAAAAEPAAAEFPERSEEKLDELAHKLYGRIRGELKRELLVDRERAGMATDLR